MSRERLAVSASVRSAAPAAAPAADAPAPAPTLALPSVELPEGPLELLEPTRELALVDVEPVL